MGSMLYYAESTEMTPEKTFTFRGRNRGHSIEHHEIGLSAEDSQVLACLHLISERQSGRVIIQKMCLG
jgi:hypothetical protein